MAFRRPARTLWAHWRAEQRTFRQGLVALALSTVAGFVAGLTLAHLTDTLDDLSGLLVLIPAAVRMKGTIFGAIGARLGTANAAGVLEPTLERGGALYRNVYVAVVTTFSSALWLAVLSRVASIAFGTPSLSIWELATIAVIGGALGSVFILLITLGLSVLSYRRGWDLDSVATPMVTALGDMTTLPSLFLATYLVRNDTVATVAAVLLLPPILDVLAGALLRPREPQLLAVPVLLSLIPPFVSQSGALGGILASRITSKLQIGVITPRGLPEGPAVVDASIVAVLSLAVFTMIGAIAWALGTATGLEGMPAFGALLRGTLLAGLIVTPLTIAASYELAILTYRFGLDPDNQSVPIITSVMDLAGVACVLLVMTSSGVLSHG